MKRSPPRGSLVDWYIGEVEKAIVVKDILYKQQIIHQIRPTLEDASKDSTSKKDMIHKFGEPRAFAKELSDPKNWEVDIGSPLSPKKEVRSFFSPKGRMLLTTMFLIGIAIPIGLFLLKPDTGWVLPGVLLTFVAIWALGVSFLNNYLGYLGTAWDLKRSEMTISTIGLETLKKQILLFAGISVLVSFVVGTSSVFFDERVFSVALPITISTITATIISSILIFKEGKKVLA